ncbi:MAG: ferrochelatase [Acidobacteriota bacterium]
MAGDRFDAVLVIAFGGPEGPGDVRPFLANVLRGRRVPAERLEAVARHYELFGGVSPLTAITRRQAEGLKVRLDASGLDLPVYVGMRNWHPLLPDVLRTMAQDGVRRAIGFICAAHRSYSSCTQYRQNVVDARAEIVGAGLPDVAVTYVGDWHADDRFVAANAGRVRRALDTLSPPLRQTARLVFTAHSIPAAMAGAGRYQSQLTESARLVAARLGVADWALVFQSRSGRPEDVWLGPDIREYLRVERAAGLDAVVLCPIGFVCDHIEVRYDLDYEAAAVCREIGLTMARAETVNDDPLFLDLMAAAVMQTAARYRSGRPLSLVPASPTRAEGPPPFRSATGLDERPGSEGRRPPDVS